MSATFKLLDIPFESLPAETIRTMCEIAVRHIGSNQNRYDHSTILKVSKIDYRVPATMRISQGYSYGSSTVWGLLSEDKEAVMTLLKTVIEEREAGTRGGHIMLGKNDIAATVLTHPDVLSFILDNAEHFGGGRDGNTCLEQNVFGAVVDSRWNTLFETHPALVAKAFASRFFLLNRFITNRGIPKERVLEVAKAAIGFSHTFGSDSPALLNRDFLLAEKDKVRSDMNEIYDELFMHMCMVCRKESENMRRIKGDLDNNSIGGKKTRRRDAGWLTTYLNGKWENGERDFVVRACRLVPPFFNLMYSTAKVSGEMRTLRRMYQLSGDAD